MMVPDDDVRLNLTVEAQTRVERSSATDVSGASYDTVDDRDGDAADADFQIRRARLGVAGSYGMGYQFRLELSADHDDQQGYQTDRGVQLYRAYAERQFYTGTVTQTLHAGLDFPFFNRADAVNRTFLFPQERATAALMTVRGVGVRYLYDAPDADLGVDIMESLDPSRPAANAGEREGLFYSARLEFSPLEGAKPAYQESWAGAPGQGVLLCGDIGFDDRDLATAGEVTERLGYGFEALLHADELSLSTELRYLRTRTTPLNAPGTTSSLHQRVFVIQGGYALPSGNDLVFEPALRLQLIDLADGTAVDYDGGGSNPTLDAEWGDTGREIDAGINCYLHRHSNKVQLSFARWQAKDSSAHADIWRLQHQLTF